MSGASPARLRIWIERVCGSCQRPTQAGAAVWGSLGWEKSLKRFYEWASYALGSWWGFLFFLNSPFNKLFFYSYSISKQKLSRFSKIKTKVSGRCECTWIQDTLNSWVMLSLPWGLWASGWNLTQSSVLGRGRLVNYPGVSHIPGLINQKWK